MLRLYPRSRSNLINLARTSPTRSMSWAGPNSLEPEDIIKDFQKYLAKSSRIMALVGAGLSAASGLPTFRGAGGIWKNHDAKSLATPEAFEKDPGLVWQFHSYRRHMALQAEPNPGHFALAELARRKENFITLSQNFDGLSQRANHPASQLHLLHGNLLDIKCSNKECDYFEPNNLTDPIVPALAPKDSSTAPKPSTTDKTGAEASSSLAAAMPSPTADDLPIDPALLPQCPKCATDPPSLLRPGVVWFGEPLPKDIIRKVDAWTCMPRKIDLMLVIGTAAAVYPAADYIEIARQRGARVAVINMDVNDLGAVGELAEGDWMFGGDASVILPRILGTGEDWWDGVESGGARETLDRGF